MSLMKQCKVFADGTSIFVSLAGAAPNKIQYTWRQGAGLWSVATFEEFVKMVEEREKRVKENMEHAAATILPKLQELGFSEVK